MIKNRETNTVFDIMWVMESSLQWPRLTIITSNDKEDANLEQPAVDIMWVMKKTLDDLHIITSNDEKL